jgi:GNAT superfamily N-acetyltransferase
MEISTDRSRLDRALVHRFLSEEAYWAIGRTREQNDRVIDSSLCFGVYEDGRQIAFARVLTDGVVFGYLGDVFVLPEARGRGVSKALLAAVVAHPDVRGLLRLTLRTADAHELYGQFGFDELAQVERWMERPRK